jgi:putative aminopeptidase FrvX
MADLLQRLIISIKADGRRIAVDQLGNVMATLKGTDATDDRVLIISGHLDSSD